VAGRARAPRRASPIGLRTGASPPGSMEANGGCAPRCAPRAPGMPLFADGAQDSAGRSGPSVALSEVEEEHRGSDSDYADGSDCEGRDRRGPADGSAADDSPGSGGSDPSASHGCVQPISLLSDRPLCGGGCMPCEERAGSAVTVAAIGGLARA